MIATRVPWRAPISLPVLADLYRDGIVHCDALDEEPWPVPADIIEAEYTEVTPPVSDAPAPDAPAPDADIDAGCGLVVLPSGRLGCTAEGQHCRWMPRHNQRGLCVLWWLSMPLLRPLAHFLSDHRWGVGGYVLATVAVVWAELHLDWTSWTLILGGYLALMVFAALGAWRWVWRPAMEEGR